MTTGGYVGLSIATLLAQHNKVTAVDIIPEKVELINQRKSPIQDEYIYDKYGIKKPRKGGFVVWNLRGHAMPLDKLVPKIIRRLEGMHFDAIIIDPIYKVITGDENSAYEALANAIILKAVEDYRRAVRQKQKEGSRRASGREHECERFFRSKWYTVLTNLDGEYLIQILNEEVLNDDG